MRQRPARPSTVRFIRYRAAPPPAPTRGALALRPSAAPPVRPPGLRLVRPEDGVDAEVRAVADAAVRLVVEVLAGTRPAAHLSLVAVPAVCREMARHRGTDRHSTDRHGTDRHGGGRHGGDPRVAGTVRGRVRIVPPKVVSTRLQRPAPAVAETAAVVVVSGRVHALALRLEHARGRWRCTALETTAQATP